jgi:hypothetical protein
LPSRRRGGRRWTISLVTEGVLGLGVLKPDVDELDPAGLQAPRRDGQADLLPWKVTVVVASTQTSETSPVEALTPEGTSTATTGTFAFRIASIERVASSRGSP